MSRSPRVLLVTPPYHAGVVESAGVWTPLQLVYLAGHARAVGADVQIYDAMSLGHGHDDIARRIAEVAPDVVAVTCFTASEPDAREVCASAKRANPRTLTVLGGVHATFCWKEILSADPSVDVIVRGEGELTFAELVAAHAAGASFERVAGLALRRDGAPMTTRPRGFVRDLDTLIPAWDLVDWPLYFYRPSPEGRFAIVSTSRGCVQACTFCSQQKLWERTWRQRSPEAVVRELAELRRAHDVRVVMLADETPTVDARRWERLLDLLVERDLGIEILMETRVDDILRDRAVLPKYRRAGVSHIYLGVESTSQETLDLYKKNVEVEQCREAIALVNAHDIVSETSFVLGGVDETPESIARTVELAKWYAPDMAFFLALAPWPYADLYPQLEAHVATRDYRRYNLVEPVIQPKGMSLDAVREALQRATGQFFHDKFRRLGELSKFKREYMVSVLELLIEHSYLGAHMHQMASSAGMPKAVATMLARLASRRRKP